MAAIEAVQLVGGPCDGERPQASSFPSSLREITVMDHAAGVEHVYAVTAERLAGDGGPERIVFRYARTAGFRATL